MVGIPGPPRQDTVSQHGLGYRFLLPLAYIAATPELAVYRQHLLAGYDPPEEHIFRRPTFDPDVDPELSLFDFVSRELSDYLVCPHRTSLSSNLDPRANADPGPSRTQSVVTSKLGGTAHSQRYAPDPCLPPGLGLTTFRGFLLVFHRSTTVHPLQRLTLNSLKKVHRA